MFYAVIMSSGINPHQNVAQMQTASSFPRRRESMNTAASDFGNVVVMDSRLRGNDGCGDVSFEARKALHPCCLPNSVIHLISGATGRQLRQLPDFRRGKTA
jgi:hypothetical protein